MDAPGRVVPALYRFGKEGVEVYAREILVFLTDCDETDDEGDDVRDGAMVVATALVTITPHL